MILNDCNTSCINHFRTFYNNSPPSHKITEVIRIGNIEGFGIKLFKEISLLTVNYLIVYESIGCDDVEAEFKRDSKLAGSEKNSIKETKIFILTSLG